MRDLIVIGGGAAGMFAAIAAREKRPTPTVSLLEKTDRVLSKVSCTGGGRCNLTNACFDRKELSQRYSRGKRELIGLFSRFQPKDTMEWFQKRGVDLKIEEGGRVFPITDSSQAIVDCLIREAFGVDIMMHVNIKGIRRCAEHYVVTFEDGEILESRALIIATGSSLEGLRWAQNLGHTIVKPVPSLFAIRVSSPISLLSGCAVDGAVVFIKGTSFSNAGSLLITHFGFSGPTILSLSSQAARYLYEKNYSCELVINWTGIRSEEEVFSLLLQLRKEKGKSITSLNPFSGIPKKLWNYFVEECVGCLEKKACDLSNREFRSLLKKLCQDVYMISGRATHKGEFVMCGGIFLKEIDCTKMESKICPHLFFAGEMLDIDGPTGGYNLQNAWTTGFISGKSAVELAKT